jgi:hypothetical protein
MLEKIVKIAVKKRLKEIGAYHHWPVQMGLGERCLDCHGCYKSKYFAIETKAPGEKLTVIQRITADRIRAAGGLVFIVDSTEAANELFRGDNFAGD